MKNRDHHAPHLKRRVFLLGAAGMTLAGLLGTAGCGGGSNNDDLNTPGERYNGTYRGRDSGDFGTAASATIDRDGLVTFWTLLVAQDERDSFADFGQTFLEDNRFELNFNGIRTFGQIQGDTIRGRTESVDDRGDGYDFELDSVREGGGGGNPPDRFVGTFEGRGRVRNIDINFLLGVSPDGGATLFSAFDNPDTSDVDVYAFESLSFDRDGDGFNYFLDQYGDRVRLEDSSGDNVRLIYTFGSNADNINVRAGDEAEILLSPTSRAVRRAQPVGGRIKAGSPGLRRLLDGFKAAK